MNYYNLSNSDLIKLIDQLPNHCLNGDKIIKELRIENFSILIIYGNMEICEPPFLMDSIGFYSTIYIKTYKIENDIKILNCLPRIHYENDFFINLDQNDQRRVANLFSGITESTKIDLKDFFDKIRYLDLYFRYEKLRTFS